MQRPVGDIQPTPVQAQTSSITRVSSFEYNAEGLLVREVVEPDRPQDCLSTTYSYDGFGNKQAVSTAACTGTSSGMYFCSAALQAAKSGPLSPPLATNQA